MVVMWDVRTKINDDTRWEKSRMHPKWVKKCEVDLKIKSSTHTSQVGEKSTLKSYMASKDEVDKTRIKQKVTHKWKKSKNDI